MGQAKLRGTHENRVLEGIAKRKADEEAARRQRARLDEQRRAEFAALPASEQKRRRDNRMLIMAVLGMSAAALSRQL